MRDWEEVEAFALTLPGAERGTSYGQPAVKAGGKAIANVSREPGSFHVRSTHDEKAVLLDTDSATFWQTPHYANWPGLLVRYASTDPDRVRLVITRAWWDASKVAVRKAWGPRPPLTRRFAHVAVIDWSGQAVARPKGLAIALAGAGSGAPALVRPERGWSRHAILDQLLGHADRESDLLIGLDLSPGFPFADEGAYFPGWPHTPADAKALWRLVDDASSDDPHLGVGGFLRQPDIARHVRHASITGDLFPAGRGRLRVCEQAQRGMGLSPSSCFNLVGAAQVGKSSLTGMRVLHALRGRIPVWPFDPVPATGPLIVEIYTSLAARAAGLRPGRSKIRDAAALDLALEALGTRPHAPLARYDDHATDAILTAAWLRAAHSDPALWNPTGLTPRIARTEGWTFGVP